MLAFRFRLASILLASSLSPALFASQDQAPATIEVAPPKQSFVVTAIGDSITRAYNTDGFFKDAPWVSWSTGERIIGGFESHLQKIAKRFPDRTMVTHNFAVTGARVADLKDQITKSGKDRPDYVTLMIGANDVCSWSEDHHAALDNFKSTLKGHLESITRSSPDVRIMMVPIPDMYRLYTLFRNRGSCLQVWDFTGICKNLLHSSRTGAQRASFRQRWVDANTALEEVAGDFPQHVIFPKEVKDYEYKATDVSSNDCFHPSIQGQNILSDLTWANGWYAH